MVTFYIDLFYLKIHYDCKCIPTPNFVVREISLEFVYGLLINSKYQNTNINTKHIKGMTSNRMTSRRH